MLFRSKRVGQELGNQMASVPGMQGSMAGAVVAGAPGAALGLAGMETVKRFGKDAIANTARAGQHLAEHLSPSGRPMAAASNPVVQSTVARETASVAAQDRGLDDAQYGATLESHPAGTDRSIAYAELLIKDPAFKERERLKATNKDHD